MDIEAKAECEMIERNRIERVLQEQSK